MAVTTEDTAVIPMVLSACTYPLQSCVFTHAKTCLLGNFEQKSATLPVVPCIPCLETLSVALAHIVIFHPSRSLFHARCIRNGFFPLLNASITLVVNQRDVAVLDDLQCKLVNVLYPLATYEPVWNVWIWVGAAGGSTLIVVLVGGCPCFSSDYPVPPLLPL